MKNLRDAIKNLYKTRLEARIAKRDFVAVATSAGPCEAVGEDEPKCYIVSGLIFADWCESCQKKHPSWVSHQTKAAKAGAALRLVLRIGKEMK